MDRHRYYSPRPIPSILEFSLVYADISHYRVIFDIQNQIRFGAHTYSNKMKDLNVKPSRG